MLFTSSGLWGCSVPGGWRPCLNTSKMPARRPRAPPPPAHRDPLPWPPIATAPVADARLQRQAVGSLVDRCFLAFPLRSPTNAPHDTARQAVVPHAPQTAPSAPPTAAAQNQDRRCPKSSPNNLMQGPLTPPCVVDGCEPVVWTTPPQPPRKMLIKGRRAETRGLLPRARMGSRL